MSPLLPFFFLFYSSRPLVFVSTEELLRWRLGSGRVQEAIPLPWSGCSGWDSAQSWFPPADVYAVFLPVPERDPRPKADSSWGAAPSDLHLRPEGAPPARRAAEGPRVTSPWCVRAATFFFSFPGQGRGGVLKRSPVR